MHVLKATVIFAVLAGLAVCSGCSKKHGSSPPVGAAPAYSVTVASEKVSGGGLKLLLNGGDDLYITKNQTYRFKTLLVSGEPYDITVATQPTAPNQTCTLTNGTGVVNGRNITAVVSCTTNKYTVGGEVSGLLGQVILHNDVTKKPYDPLTIDAAGPFTFTKDVTDRNNYSVSVFRQPSVQTCTITHGSATVRGANVDNVMVNCADNVPTISLKSASVVEGDTGTSYLEFIVNLSLLARNDITVHYTTAGDADKDGVTDDLDLCPGTVANATVDVNGCSAAQIPIDTLASPGNDYTVTTGDLPIYAGTSTATITVPVVGDAIPEANETLTLTLTKPAGVVDWNATFGVSGNIPISSLTATGTIYNDDGGALNDTAITGCANADTNNLACSTTGNGTGIGTGGGTATYPGQDGETGRDVTVNDDTDGHAGFSFQKIDSSGNDVLAAATQWSCVEDLTTKLMWEAKTTDGGLHAQDWTYSWYDADSKTNGGDPGTPGGGSCGNSLIACDTETLLTAVNSGGLCSYHDWRLPTAEELSSLIDSSVASGPTIDVGWFPNTKNAIYWTSSPYASYSYYAWGVDFGNGAIIGNLLKNTPLYVRLVRGGP